MCLSKYFDSKGLLLVTFVLSSLIITQFFSFSVSSLASLISDSTVYQVKIGLRTVARVPDL